MIDWKAQRDDIFSDLVPLLTADERKLLPEQDECPDDAAGTIAALRQALTRSGRRLVHTESFGDFSFIILMPKDNEQEFTEVVGPWLINDENT
jgi:hypothetical protein